MNVDEALEFLGQNQPFPSELEWPEELVTRLGELVEFLGKEKDSRIVGPLFGSLGESDVCGRRDTLCARIAEYDTETLRPVIEAGLKSSCELTKTDTLLIIGNHGKRIFMDELKDALASGSEDIRYAAGEGLRHLVNEEDRNWIVAGLANPRDQLDEDIHSTLKRRLDE